MKTVENKTGSNFNNYFKVNKQLQKFEKQNHRKVAALPSTIESFLQDNYGNYNVDQVIVHKQGPEVFEYEIGVASVYEYTVHFNAKGEFFKVDLIE